MNIYVCRNQPGYLITPTAHSRTASEDLRGESVEATGLQLQQAVLPVGFGDAEVVDGASEDEEGFLLQGEMRRVGLQSFNDSMHFYFRLVPDKEIKQYALKNKEYSTLNECK